MYRASAKHGTYKKIESIKDKNQRSFRDQNCKYGQTYYYKIKAYGTTKDGKKIYSELSGPAKGKAMGASKVTAVKCRAVNDDTVGLTWNRVKNADGYVVYRKKSSDREYKKIKTIASGKKNSWKNTKLQTGKKYYYKIRAYRKTKGTNYYSEFSAIKSGKPKLSQPKVSINNKKKTVVITWKKVQGAKGYEIYRKKGNGGHWKLVKKTTGNSKRYTNKGLKKGVKYQYKVRAYKNAGGKRVYSSFSKVKAKKL